MAKFRHRTTGEEFIAETYSVDGRGAVRLQGLRIGGGLILGGDAEIDVADTVDPVDDEAKQILTQAAVTNPFALALQRAGLRFISAQVTHTGNNICGEIVCATSDDAAAVDAWAKQEGLAVTARIATTEEFRAHEETVW